MTYLVLRNMDYEPDSDEFDTEETAVNFAMYNLPSDDYVYGIFDTEIDEYTCIVFQRQVWRPE